MSSASSTRDLFLRQLASPLGVLTAVVDASGYLRHLDFEGRSRPPLVEVQQAEQPQAHETPDRASQTLRKTQEQLVEYFSHQRREFDLPLLATGTEFQQSVWEALCAIPFGATESYGALARRLSNPKAVRAVGRANGQNPIAIVVPCHRVIGADGSLTGYGGGLDRKRWLLEHEGVLLPFRSF